eukprot:gene4022-4270_t
MQDGGGETRQPDQRVIMHKFTQDEQYLQERDLDWAYWPLDGQMGPSREWKGEETYGILNTTWSGFAYQPLLDVLRTIMI